MICTLKQCLPISEIKHLINLRIQRTSVEETLNFFSNLYDSTFNTVIAIGKKFSLKEAADDEFLSDTALYMAIGSSASKYIASQISEINKEDKEKNN